MQESIKFHLYHYKISQLSLRYPLVNLKIINSKHLANKVARENLSLLNHISQLLLAKEFGIDEF